MCAQGCAVRENGVRWFGFNANLSVVKESKSDIRFIALP